MNQRELSDYMSNSLKAIIKGALKTSLQNPKETAFLSRAVRTAQKASKRRKAMAQKGLHVPPFLIAAITSECNLHCVGCYARDVNHCQSSRELLSVTRWNQIFDEAETLGINFILLAGGEPMMRQDVIDKAAAHKHIIFPVITNGTLFTPKKAEFFDSHRNLVPIISVEGQQETTDRRRGNGTYESLSRAMELLAQKGILFGASITVTKDNLGEVTSKEFVGTLTKKGCRVILYIEYVPATQGTELLTLGKEERKVFQTRLNQRRKDSPEAVMIAFPGDEEALGGCLAAGRGFFYINPTGGAEPCPFSPHSDTNLKTSTIAQCLRSPLFQKLQKNSLMNHPHSGGCALFGHDSEVENLMK